MECSHVFNGWYMAQIGQAIVLLFHAILDPVLQFFCVCLLNSRCIHWETTQKCAIGPLKSVTNQFFDQERRNVWLKPIRKKRKCTTTNLVSCFSKKKKKKKKKLGKLIFIMGHFFWRWCNLAGQFLWATFYIFIYLFLNLARQHCFCSMFVC